MSTSEGIGARLRRLRRERGLTQQDLAGPTVSASYVSLIETGKREATPQAVTWLASHLAVTPRYLTTGRADEERELELRHAQLELANGDAAHAATRFAALLDDDDQIAHDARWGLAEANEAQGRLEQAADAYEALLAEASAGQRAVPTLRCCVALSRCYREVGDLSRAVDVGERGLERLREYGLESSDLEIDLLCTVAFAYQERGDVVRATQLLTRVRRKADALGTPRARGAAYWNASLLAADLSQGGDALDLADRALALFGEGDDTRNLARLHNARAGLLLRVFPARAEEALSLLEQARRTLLASGSQVDVAYCETEMSRALTLLGRADDAQELALSALDRLGPNTRVEAARARLALGYALVGAGRWSSARAQYRTAAEELGRAGAPRQAAAAWVELSEHSRAHGDHEAALQAVLRAAGSVGLSSPFATPPVPTAVPPTAVPPTAVPPTVVPSTVVPPSASLQEARVPR